MLRSSPSRLGIQGAPVLAGQAAVALVIVLVIAAGPLPTLGAAQLSWLASVAFSVATLIAGRHLVRRLPVGEPARRLWWAICFNAVTSGTGYLLQLIMVRDPHRLTLEPVPVTIVGLGTVTVVATLSTYPLRIRSGRERFCFWLDMATVMVGATAFAWYFTTVDDTSPALLTVLTGPVAMLVAVFAVAKLLIAGRPPFNPYTGLLGGASAVVGGVVGVWGPAAVAGGGARALLAISALGDALMTLAIWLQRLRADEAPARSDRPRRRPYSVLPYVALTGTFTLLVRVLHDRGLDGQSMAVLACAALSTAIVVMRQVTSFTENARLLRELDFTVAELREKETVLRSALAERDTLAARLHELAYQDSLTGLSNRAMFHDRLTAAFSHRRSADVPVTVMLLDLDEFKPVNDRFGHAAGDAVLQHVAAQLRGCLRDTDTVARLGGDEFAILLDSALPEDLGALTTRIMAAVRQPCHHDGIPLTVGVSVGTAVARPGESSPDQLLRAADSNMYAAKNNRSAERTANR